MENKVVIFIFILLFEGPIMNISGNPTLEVVMLQHIYFCR